MEIAESEGKIFLHEKSNIDRLRSKKKNGKNFCRFVSLLASRLTHVSCGIRTARLLTTEAGTAEKSLSAFGLAFVPVNEKQHGDDHRHGQRRRDHADGNQPGRRGRFGRLRFRFTLAVDQGQGLRRVRLGFCHQRKSENALNVFVLHVTKSANGGFGRNQPILYK